MRDNIKGFFYEAELMEKLVKECGDVKENHIDSTNMVAVSKSRLLKFLLKTIEKAKEETISHIAIQEGWEETEEYYRKRLIK